MYSCTSEGMFPWNNEKSLCPAFIEKQNKTKQKSTHSQFVQVGEAWNCTKLAFLRLTQTINVRSHQKLTTAGNVKVSYRGVGEVETRLLGSQGLWCLKSKWSCEKKLGMVYQKLLGRGREREIPLIPQQFAAGQILERVAFQVRVWMWMSQQLGAGVPGREHQDCERIKEHHAEQAGFGERMGWGETCEWKYGVAGVVEHTFNPANLLLIYLYIIRYIFLIHSLCIWRSLLLYQKVINKPSVCQCFHTAIMDARTHYWVV